MNMVQQNQNNFHDMEDLIYEEHAVVVSDR